MFSLPTNAFGTPPTLVAMETNENMFYPVGTDEEDYDEVEDPPFEPMVPAIEPIDVTSSDWTHQEPKDPESPSNFYMGGLNTVTLSPIVVPGSGGPFGFAKGGPETKRHFTFDNECPPAFIVHEKAPLPSKTIFPVKQAEVRGKPSSPFKLGRDGKATDIEPFEKAQQVNLAMPVIKKEPKFFMKPEKEAGATSKGGPKRRARQTWTKAEDKRLLDLLHETVSHPKSDLADLQANWGDIAAKMNTDRTAKQCRDRWHNYLRPGIKKGDWTKLEEKHITELYAKLGGKWSVMAQIIPHRSENDIKNKWNSMQRKEKRRRKQTRARPGLKKPPSLAVPTVRESHQAGNTGNKTVGSFANPLDLPALEITSSTFYGAGEETIVPHEA